MQARRAARSLAGPCGGGGGEGCYHLRRSAGQRATAAGQPPTAAPQTINRRVAVANAWRQGPRRQKGTILFPS